MARLAKRIAVRLFGARALTAEEREWLRLRGLPRYEHTATMALGRKLALADAPSFLAMHEEIFRREIYRFQPGAEIPIIIDGGANIGVSVIWFAQNYPGAKITAFEADPAIAGLLRANLQSFGVENVELVEAALWDADGRVEFASEGADAGRVEPNGGGRHGAAVAAKRLGPYLTGRQVDLLKLDIEGAELRVLRDVEPHLANVRSLFVEYHSSVESRQELPELCALLRDAGFRLHVEGIHGAIPRRPLYDPPPFPGDLQLNIFGFRPPAQVNQP